MTTGMRNFLRIIRLVVNQLTFPVMKSHERVIFLYSAVWCKTKLYYESDVRDTVMIVYVICQLVCVTDPWAHTSFVHSILSLKLGVTCPFFRYCWNKGLKLPTRHNCPECSNQYWKFRQYEINHRSIHTQDAYHHNNMDQCLKSGSVHNRLGKRVVDQDWADYEEGNERKYV